MKVELGPHATPNDDATIPLCVDLDGTLTPTDILLESALKLFRLRPLQSVAMAAWLLRGKAYLKAQIAERVQLDVARLPFNPDVLAFLEREHARGREIVLVTAANEGPAREIAEFCGVFDGVLASDGERNLCGREKLALLSERYGAGFDYIGNARADLAVWRGSRRAFVTAASPRVRRAAIAWGNADLSLAVDRRSWLPTLRALRPHQWLKNLLIFLPLLFAHRLYDTGAITRDLFAFVAFSLCASGIYVVNDLLDLENDRRHRSKARRPFASGTVPLARGLALAPMLLLAGFAIACAVTPLFIVVMAGYVVLSLSYSLALKRIVLLDVIVLAGLYTARIMAGAAAAEVVASFWLLAFALFMFSSLAMVKRYSELLTLQADQSLSVAGRDYSRKDSDMIAMLGVASGYVAVLVVALYINGDLVRHLYAHPAVLWGICPILLYWISRVWLIAHRGQMHDDPILFALKDPVSLIVALLVAAVGLTAMLPVRL